MHKDGFGGARTMGFGALVRIFWRAELTVIAAAMLLLAPVNVAHAGLFGKDEPLKLNEIQLLGSHNSYKRPIPKAVMSEIEKVNPTLAAALAYEHPPLADQLALGLRQLEIDVFADPKGGHYLTPLGAAMSSGDDDAPRLDTVALSRPGFKVFHIQDLDYDTHCAAFTTCLSTIKTWSDLNPGHLPIIITINPKTESIGVPGSTDPVPFTAQLFNDLDTEIRSVFPDDRLITPDLVRGKHITLESAILAEGWPELEGLRGRIMFVLDTRPKVAALYKQDHTALRGRAMFGSFPPGTPEAGVVILNDPVKNRDVIQDLVTKGYIVRTRSDADTVEARNGDLTRFEAAMKSGAQIISTDYYPGAPDPLGLGFEISFKKSRLVHCNRVLDADSCRVKKLQPPKRRR